jgi:uncharacterized protein YycO
MAAGDVLLFHRPTTWANFRRDKFGTVMTTLIHLTTRSKWNHAALDIGDGMMVEATSGGVRVNPARSSDEIHVVAHIAVGTHTGLGAWHCQPGDRVDNFYNGNDLEEVLAWSTGRVGWKYGFLNAFWCGLRNLFPGMAHVKHGKTIICSELVSEALARAGHDFQKDYALVSPGDLAEHFGVER